MSYALVSIRSRIGCLGAAALIFAGNSALALGGVPVTEGLSRTKAEATNIGVCASRDTCINAIMATARTKEQVRQLFMMARLRRMTIDNTSEAPGPIFRSNRAGETLAVGNIDAILTTILLETKNHNPAIPDLQRALALSYLKAGQAQKAEQALREAIALSPTHAPFWVDLAMALAAQGNTGDAVSALMVADTWSLNPKATRSAYEQAMQAPSIKGMNLVYGEALQRIAANTAAQEAADLELPPIPAQWPGQNKEKGSKPGNILFNGCEKPEWPRSSLRYEETGRVMLAFFVDEHGMLLRARKLESSGYAELDNAAFSAVAACAFQPPLVDDQPVPGWVKIQYVWTLE